MTDRLFEPSRSDIWKADFDHLLLDQEDRIIRDENGEPIYTRYNEHGNIRPCLVLSNNEFNKRKSNLVIVVPLTTRDKGISNHVRINPPEGGLREPSFAICEGIRSIARQFLICRWGQVEDNTIRKVELVLKNLMRFGD